jgi:O-antigen ligase
VPYLDQSDSVMWAVISLYLAITAIFFAMFFSDDTHRRVELALKAFLASCLVAATAGIMGYFDILGTYERFTDMDRAMGTFRDPNVFGSFLILGVLYVSRDLLTGEGKRPLLGFVLLPILLIGIFLAFSRGTWAVTVLAIALLVVMTFTTSRSARVRRRIVTMSVVTGMLAVASIIGLLTREEVRGMFEERAHVVQPYDTGETGRFGQHLRAIPELLDRPNGFGPMRYKYMFRFDPHNTYLNSFASGGWIGGIAFLGLVLLTTFVGLRLSLRPSPYQAHAQIFFAAHVTLVLQSFQIDVDHWRQVYLIWGALWGLEAARVRWVAAQRSMAAYVTQMR